MAHSTRPSRCSLKKYYELCKEGEDDLNRYLTVIFNSISSDEELTEFISAIKLSFKNLSVVYHEIICTLTKSGSYDEANEYKDARNERRHEVKEQVTHAKSLIKSSDVRDIVSDIDSTSHYSSLGRAESVINDFGEETLAFQNMRLSHKHISTDSSGLLPSDNLPVNLPPVSSSQKFVCLPTTKSTQSFPLFSSASFLSTRYNLSDCPVSAQGYLSTTTTNAKFPYHATSNIPPVCSSGAIPSRPLLYPPQNFPYNPGHFSAHSNTGLYSSVGHRHQTPQVSSHNLDPASLHLVKQQLFQKSTDPYKGNPEGFHSWMDSIENLTAGLNLSARDHLQILKANTEGAPLQIVKRHMMIGGRDPSRILDAVMDEFRHEFGADIRIASALNERLNIFPNITSMQNLTKMKELLTLCQHIEANMRDCVELRHLDSTNGLRTIWLKLPERLQHAFSSFSSDYRRNHSGQYPSFSQLVFFLSEKLRDLSDPLFAKHNARGFSKPSENYVLRTDFSVNDEPEAPDGFCPLHNLEGHGLIDCKKFARLPPNERIAFLKERKMCFRCLGDHLKSDCTTCVKCDKCGRDHLTIFHFEENSYPRSKLKSTQSASSLDVSRSSLCTKICKNKDHLKDCSKVLLVDLFLRGSDIKPLRCYAILDDQSTSSFVDPKVAEYFKVSSPASDYTLKTLAGSSTTVRGIILKDLSVRGVNENTKFKLPTVSTNPFIPDCKAEVATPGLVRCHPSISHLSKHFCEFDDKADVLLLLGRDSGSCLYTRIINRSLPYVCKTALGWALLGNCCASQEVGKTVCVLKSTKEHFSNSFSFRNEDKWLLPDKIFERHHDDDRPGLSKEDRSFLHKLDSNVHQDNSGNIILPLPFRKTNPVLPDNRSEVFCRTKSTLSRLARDHEKANKCVTTMQKYIDSKHVEAVPKSEEKPKCNNRAWWIPVFPVSHAKKNKIRIVFDSSAKYQGTSLNDQLLPGPDLNNKLKSVLIGFRNGCIGVAADVECMFHNFILPADERDYLRFFWYKDNVFTNNIVQYRANVHVFGNTSSPSVATIGLRYAAKSSSYSEVQNFVENQFYVDDGLIATDTVKDAVHILKMTIETLQLSNIRLHKICSSDNEVTEAFPPSELARNSFVELNEQNTTSTLGLRWMCSSDRLVIQSEVPERPFTRRGILATVNSVFDPLGISSPILLDGKHLQRKIIASANTTDEHFWDEELPDLFRASWLMWKKSLTQLSGLSIPRSYRPKDFGTVYSCQLHGYCDASNDGTGYVIYLRSINEEGRVSISFVSASSKIVPKRVPTIPRLELCAALDLSSNIGDVSEKLDIPPESVFLHTDSTIVLGYLTNSTKRFSGYVTRRRDEILRNHDVSRWNYVETSGNPADIASRRQSFQTLSTSCWLSGPDKLYTFVPKQLPNIPSDLPETDASESVFKTTLVTNPIIDSILSKCSSLTKALGVLVHVVNFGITLKNRVNSSKDTPMRSFINRDDALKYVIRSSQSCHFPQLLSDTRSQCGNLIQLSPFIDENGIIRVGGRLAESKLDYCNKYPILIPQKGYLTMLLISHFHHRVKHQGRCLTLNAIRQAGYFIHKCSTTIRKFINSCITCKKLRLNLSSQFMADLPGDRLECVPPFTNTGMDVFGPYEVTDGVSTRRSKTCKKCWAVVFTCLNSRAIHVEPLPFMDISSMKNAIRRFICIRGPVKLLRSDQGTNFTGTRNQDLKSALLSESQYHGFQWILNPPKASHHGGVWERPIQSIKKILSNCLHLLGSRLLSRDELYTYLQECVCILNNSPLWEHSSDPNDPRPLTPSMLLNLRGNDSLNDEFHSMDVLSYGSKRWRRVQYLSDQFWSRWKVDYLQTLQRRQKWTKPHRSFRTGDVVLLKDSQSKRYQWPIAKVSAVKCSADGLVRSVEVLTACRGSSGLRKLCRPINELSLLVPSTEVSHLERGVSRQRDASIS